jgi:branched-chain amino acid transport system permease protein
MKPRLWHPLESLAWLAAASSWFLFGSWHPLLNDVAITALFALSLDLVLGYGGIVTLGHAAFFGFGAYVAGYMAKIGLGDPLFCLAVGGLATAALGFATSFLVLRGSDLTRLMVTVAAAAVLQEIANRWISVTGGSDGMDGLAIRPLFGRITFGLDGHAAYAFSLVVLFLCFVVARVLVRSPFGWSVRAVGANSRRAAAIGIPVTRRLVGIYTIGAGYAGIAGALLTVTTQFASLEGLSIQRSADTLLMVVVGGPGTLYGALAGAVVFRLVQNFLSNLTPEYWQFWVGIALMGLVLARPEGDAPWPVLLWRRVLARVQGGRR